MSVESFLSKAYEGSTSHNLRDVSSAEDILVIFKGIGYDNVPVDVAQRLSYLSLPTETKNSHFQDALDIAEIVDDLIPETLPDSEVNELRAASLLHDVGKSGPPNASAEQQLAFVTVFNLNFPYGQVIDGVKISDVSIKRALELKVADGEITVERASELLGLISDASVAQESQRTENIITPETPMGVFWSAHVYWTYDVLKKTSLPKSLIGVAASHHLLEGHDPVGVNMDYVTSGMVSLELADKYQAYRIRLLLADKYQAFLQRSGHTHEETIQIMRKRINEFFKDCPPNREPLRDQYLQVLEQIDQKKEVFARELELENK